MYGESHRHWNGSFGIQNVYSGKYIDDFGFAYGGNPDVSTRRELDHRAGLEARSEALSERPPNFRVPADHPLPALDVLAG